MSQRSNFFFFLVCIQFTQIKFPLFAHLRLGNPVGIRLVAAKFVDKIELLRTTWKIHSGWTTKADTALQPGDLYLIWEAKVPAAGSETKPPLPGSESWHEEEVSTLRNCPDEETAQKNQTLPPTLSWQKLPNGEACSQLTWSSSRRARASDEWKKLKLKLCC